MKKSNTYHNTTNQSKKFVYNAFKKCKNQEEKVMTMINSHKRLTASQVWKLYFDTVKPPLTSLRRALSNLTHEGKLTKEDKTKIGLYGAPEHYYTLNESK